MRLNHILTIYFIFLAIHSSGSVDLTQKLPFTSGGELYIINNPTSHDPTYSELLSFLQNDTTDTLTYHSKFMCGEFATLLHNNAESQGIRSGVVNIRFQNQTVGHTINAFNTTDQGLVFIDCTGSNRDTDDKIATLETNSEYVVESLFDPLNVTIEYKTLKYNTSEGEQTVNLPYMKATGYSYDYNKTVSRYTIIW